MSHLAAKLLAALDHRENEARAAARREAQERKADDLRFKQACAAAHDLLEGVFQPMFEEFSKIMEGRDVLRPGRVRLECPAAYRLDAGMLRLVFRALGAARGRRVYEVRLAADVRQKGALEFSAECVRYLPADSRRVEKDQPPQPLVELLRERQEITAGRIDVEAARQWCEDILERAAAAVLQANLNAEGPLCAPLVAMPGAAIAVPAG